MEVADNYPEKNYLRKTLHLRMLFPLGFVIVIITTPSQLGAYEAPVGSRKLKY